MTGGHGCECARRFSDSKYKVNVTEASCATDQRLSTMAEEAEDEHTRSPVARPEVNAAATMPVAATAATSVTTMAQQPQSSSSQV